MDFADYHALVQLYADYAYAVDSGDWSLWPEFFVEACSYRLVPRENHERGFPLATLAFEEQGHAEGPGLRHQGNAVPRPRTTSATSSVRRW
jgi:3-phenylpropionate/cinnamic acid dioxygenase small subunit